MKLRRAHFNGERANKCGPLRNACASARANTQTLHPFACTFSSANSLPWHAQDAREKSSLTSDAWLMMCERHTLSAAAVVHWQVKCMLGLWHPDIWYPNTLFCHTIYDWGSMAIGANPLLFTWFSRDRTSYVGKQTEPNDRTAHNTRTNVPWTNRMFRGKLNWPAAYAASSPCLTKVSCASRTWPSIGDAHCQRSIVLQSWIMRRLIKYLNWHIFQVFNIVFSIF